MKKNVVFLVLALLFHIGVARDANVVLILIDDISHYGIGAYEGVTVKSTHDNFTGGLVHTPTIDAMAQQGVRCDAAYVYPLCESTRIALMSGKTNHRNYLDCKSQHASDITFGDVFQREGYATGIFGKWKQTRGTKEIPGEKYIYEFGWDEFCCFDVTMEGQRFINPNLVINGEIVNCNGRTDIDPHTGRRWYGPDICNRHALEFIDKHKNGKFFLYYSMLLMHDDHKPTPDTKPNSIFDNFDEKPHNRDGHTGDDPQYFPDMLAYTDKLINKVIDKLEEHDLTENTLVVIMGDNGTKEIFTHILKDGSEYPGRKGGNTDNGLHVPLILRMPGTIKPEQSYGGLTYVTDIFPTIADAAGISIPNQRDIDGISFWPQMLGETTREHRDVICTWYSGNNEYTNTDAIIRYAFNKDFKRYAPSTRYPEGRFFDLRTDPLERVGDTFVELNWGVRRYSGVDTHKLDSVQQLAYNYLGEILDHNEYKAVKELKITPGNKTLETGETIQLNYELIPADATRNGVIWESSDPGIATVNKFGELTACQPGMVTVRIFSWDDAYPKASNRDKTYYKTGIQDSVVFQVK